MNKTPAVIGMALLAQTLAACDSDSRSPSAASAATQPGVSTTPSGTLAVFRDQRTGFSTSDLRDAGGQIVQLNSAGELIWTADGTRLPGYRAQGNGIPAEPVCRCWLIVRYGIADGERRAYLTADYIHDNPGTLVDLDIVDGVLRVDRTNIYAPGTYTQSGVITEVTPAGLVPLPDAGIWRLDEEQYGWQVAKTDRNGYYELHGLYDGSRSVSVIKDGYETINQNVVIDGNTRFDSQLVKR